MAELRVKSTGTIKLFENDNTSSVTIASPASLGADRTVTLPDASVTLASGTMLATDGDGSSLTGIPALTGTTNNTCVTVTGANAIQGEASMTYDGTTLELTTSGGGLKLDNLDSSDAHTLDDYEEGSWTPTCATGGASPSYSSQDGRYTKVGNMVYLEMHLNFTSSSSNTMTVGALPFTVKNSEPSPVWMLFREDDSSTYYEIIPSQGSTLGYPKVLNASGLQTVDNWTGIAMRAVMMYTEE